MTTALDIIQDSLETLGVYAAGETITSADGARALFVLNKLLDEWAAQKVYVYQLISTTATITSGTSKYTIGPTGAAITAPRPPRIEYGEGAASLLVSGATTPVNVVSAIEYQALSGYSPAAGTPDTLWYDAAYPIGALNLLPAPNVSGTLTFSAWQRFASFTSLDTSYTLADGVQDGLTTNLAVMLKPYFSTAQLDPAIAVSAAHSKDFLRFQGMTSRAMFRRFVLSTNPQAQG